MGILDRVRSSRQHKTQARMQQEIEPYVQSMTRVILKGLEAAGILTDQDPEEIREDVSALCLSALVNDNEDLAQFVQRMSLVFSIHLNEEISDQEWGEWLFKETAWLLDYRQVFLNAGRRDLERHLSHLASRQHELIQAGPRCDSVMIQMHLAAKRYLIENQNA